MAACRWLPALTRRLLRGALPPGPRPEEMPFPHRLLQRAQRAVYSPQYVRSQQTQILSSTRPYHSPFAGELGKIIPIDRGPRLPVRTKPYLP